MKNILMLWVVAVSLPALGATWKVDSSHSAVNFKVRHMMVSNVRGAISGLDGTVELDKDKVSKVEITADPTTINTGDAKRDEHLKSEDFFNSTKFPKISFASTKVTPKKGGNFSITGKLTLHGVTKNVTFTGEGLTKAVKGPWGNMRRGFTATTKVNRKDFGMTWNKSLDGGGIVVGDQVDVTVEVEIIQPSEKKS